jgi:hypothetical protein
MWWTCVSSGRVGGGECAEGPGSSWLSAARSTRSAGRRRGRATCRLSTCNSCRRTRISTSFARSSRPRRTSSSSSRRTAQYRKNRIESSSDRAHTLTLRTCDDAQPPTGAWILGTHGVYGLALAACWTHDPQDWPAADVFEREVDAMRLGIDGDGMCVVGELRLAELAQRSPFARRRRRPGRFRRRRRGVAVQGRSRERRGRPRRLVSVGRASFSDRRRTASRSARMRRTRAAARRRGEDRVHGHSRAVQAPG